MTYKKHPTSHNRTHRTFGWQRWVYLCNHARRKERKKERKKDRLEMRRIKAKISSFSDMFRAVCINFSCVFFSTSNLYPSEKPLYRALICKAYTIPTYNIE